jgi:hydroxyethylthiazole kinase
METLSPAFLFARVRELRPLVHHITNIVTVNDCANVTLAIGAAPVMADAPEEVAEMAGVADALVLNIGTLSTAQVEAMLLAGEAANSRGIPIVLDPVGTGATRFRTATALRLLDGLEIAVLKGNAGEIGTIAGVEACVRGVDSAGLAGEPAEVCSRLATHLGCNVAMSGPMDIVSDGSRVAFVKNGHPLMGSVSGTGCMVASVAAAFAAVTDDRFAAAVAALATFGLAGERAAEMAGGPGTFRPRLLDALAGMEPGMLVAGARVRFE